MRRAEISDENCRKLHGSFGPSFSCFPCTIPPHPGEFIAEVYLEPNNISGRELAVGLGVSASTLHRVLNGMGAVSPVMAQRLSKSLGRSPESWLAMQSNYDLWPAWRLVKLDKIHQLELKPLSD